MKLKDEVKVMNVNSLKQKLESKIVEERLSGLRDAIAESEALAVYVIKDYVVKESDETILAAMIIACAKIGGETEIDFIGSYLNHSSVKIKKYAFQSLALINSIKVYPYIFKLLTDADVRFRQLAVKEIRHLGKKESLGIIENMIASEIDWHRKSALGVLEMLNNILYENELVDILARAITNSKAGNCRDCVTKLKNLTDAGSEYAAASIEAIKKSASDDIKAVISEITGVIETKPLPASAAAEIKEGAVKAESPPKEEVIISEFSSYVDTVVREKKISTGSPRVMISDSGAALESGETGRLKRTASFLYDLFILKPAAMAVRHKYKLAVVMAFFIFAFFYVFPEFILGKGSFVELDPGGRQSIESHLNSNGYRLNKSGNGVPLVYEHRYWTSSIPFFEGVFGKTIMFSAYEVNLKNTDIFEAAVKFDKYGEVSRLDKIRNISETSSADENDLIIMKNSFAYLSSADSGMKILTIEEGDGSNKRQFLFKNLVNINKIENSALALNLIKVETNRGTNKTNVSLNVDSGTIDPPDFPVEYLPNIEADEPMLPKIVEKVRSLNFVGPEKIAKLEDCYYQTSDFFKRKFYGSTEEEKEEETNSFKANKVEESIVSGEPMFENIRTTEAVEMVTDAITVKIKEFCDHNALLVKNITGFDEKKFKGIIAASAAPAASIGTQEVKLLTDAATTSVNIAELAMPANIAPIYKKSVMKDEGVWSTEETPLLNGRNYLFKTKVRVDPKRPFAIMHIASIDISKVDMKLVPGTEEPVSTMGLKGKGSIPGDAATYQNLICAFNGGFRSKHGKWGFISDGVTYLSPANGIATIAVDSKGNIKIGTWGGPALDTKENYVHLRQNLPPILENGKLNVNNQYWGASVDNKTNVWRSAIGISKDGKRLVYGAGNSLTFDTLAKGMEMAGCDYAMQLDINEYHTYFHLYKLNGTDKKGNLKLKVTRLTDEMANETQRCIKPYTRDFFYLTWKNNEIQTASVKQ